MGFAEKALALSVNPHESRGFLAPSSRFRPRLNREFSFNYQGIVIVYLGKLRSISELRNPSSQRISYPQWTFVHLPLILVVAHQFSPAKALYVQAQDSARRVSYFSGQMMG